MSVTDEFEHTEAITVSSITKQGIIAYLHEQLQHTFYGSLMSHTFFVVG